MLVDFVATVGRHGRLLDLRKKIGEVGQLKWRLVLLQKCNHFARNVTFVEPVACRGNTRHAAFAFVRALGLDHSRQSTRKRGKLNCLPGLVHRSIRLQPIALVIGPSLEELQITLDGSRRERPHWKALRCIVDGPGRYVLEAHGAPPLEYGKSCMERAGDHGRIETCAVQVLAA